MHLSQSMKNTILLASLIFWLRPNFAFATEMLVVELGDSLKIKHVAEKIWIENPRIAQAQSTAWGLQIKGLAIGSSRIRIDKKNKMLTVLPAGQLQSYSDWKKLSYQFADINVGPCSNLICLKGTITILKEFEKIINLMDENSAHVYLGLKISSTLQIQIENWYERHLKKNGIPPHKIVFGTLWTTYTSQIESLNKYKLEFEKIGIHLIEDKQKLTISDNLRVEIKVVEVKKELVRRLGIKWPDTYTASVLDLTPQGWNSFDTMLNASELSGDMNILASPNLICKSGKEAAFFAGGEFPIKTIGDKFSSVVWKQYGIQLKIKPQIDSIGQINLEIESEVSSIDKSREVDGVPALHSHKVSSHFDLTKSQTIVLSGLIKSETGNSSEGLPYLSQIPILGRLFASKDYLENKTELVIFVTPKISE